jgi:hypothetical protein
VIHFGVMVGARRPTPLRLDQADYDRVETLAGVLTRHNVSDMLRILICEALDAREGVSRSVSVLKKSAIHVEGVGRVPAVVPLPAGVGVSGDRVVSNKSTAELLAERAARRLGRKP